MSTTIRAERTREIRLDDPAAPEPLDRPLAHRLLATLRIAMGWVFLWAFLDKTFGLGFATASGDSWINGGSPTFGFLNFGTEGKTFHDAFAGLSGGAADWVFMIGLLGIGLALMLGIGMRIAAVSSGLMLVFMWLASLPLDNNPFFDDHLAYALVLVLLAVTHAGDTWGFGDWWAERSFVQRYSVLR